MNIGLFPGQPLIVIKSLVLCAATLHILISDSLSVPDNLDMLKLNKGAIARTRQCWNMSSSISITNSDLIIITKINQSINQSMKVYVYFLIEEQKDFYLKWKHIFSDNDKLTHFAFLALTNKLACHGRMCTSRLEMRRRLCWGGHCLQVWGGNLQCWWPYVVLWG